MSALDLGLLLQQLDRLGLEDGDRAGELADLVGGQRTGNVDGGIVAGEPDQGPADRLQPRQHPMQEQQAERTDQQTRDRRSRGNPGDEGARPFAKPRQRLLHFIETAHALRREAALQPRHGLGVGRCGGERLRPLAQLRRIDRRLTRRGDRVEPQRQLVVCALRARDERCDVRRQRLVGTLVGIERAAIGGGRRARHQPLVVAQQLLDAGDHLDRRQPARAQPRRCLLGPPGEMDGDRGQHVDHGQEQRDGAVELGGDLRTRQSQASRHRSPQSPRHTGRPPRPACVQPGSALAVGTDMKIGLQRTSVTPRRRTSRAVQGLAPSPRRAEF